MLMAGQYNIGPDFVGNDLHIIFPAQLCHGPDLFLLPDPAGGIMGRTEDHGRNIAFTELFLHIRQIHPENALRIPDQGTADDLIPVVF